jgi:hypothetical protein
MGNNPSCPHACHKARFAQAFRQAIKLAILLKTSTFKNKNKLFVESKQNSLGQYCQQHYRICKPALNSLFNSVGLSLDSDSANLYGLILNSKSTIQKFHL